MCIRDSRQGEPNPAVIELGPDQGRDVGNELRERERLLANAIRHTPAGGEILVAARPDGDSQIRVTVCDTGPGLSPEDVSHLFDRFYRGERARAAGPGAGLGLSVAKAIVDAHGGRIWAENRPTGGACFHCALPRGACI